MIKLAAYCEAQNKASQMLAEIRSEAVTSNELHVDVDLAKETIQKMLESVSLNVREFAAFEIVGVNLGSNNVINERISSTEICKQLLRGIQASYNFEFSGILSTNQYSSKFGKTTDFELASLCMPPEDTMSYHHSRSPKRSMDPQLHQQPQHHLFQIGPLCSICKRPYKNITLRNSLRKRICKACGLSCCATCCSAKVFHEKTGVHVEICTQCAFTS